MISNFCKSLKALEKAFMLNAKTVVEASCNLEGACNNIKKAIREETITLENKDFKTTTQLLEKLSIQNDIKLSLLRDFPEYLSTKK